MTKKQFYEKYFPYLYREEHLSFWEDIDRLVEDEIYHYVHSDDGLGVHPGEVVMIGYLDSASNEQPAEPLPDEFSSMGPDGLT